MILRLVAIAILAITLSGCWNYREVNELGLAMGLAVDQGENGNFIVSTEVIDVQGSGRQVEFRPFMVETEREMIFESVRDMILQTGQRLYWAHAMLLVVSEEVAGGDLRPILEWIVRDAEVRSDLWMVVAHGSLAKEVLAARSKPNEIVSLKLADMMKAQRSAPKFIAKQIWRFRQELSSEGQAATVPTIRLIEKEMRKVPEVSGTAVFKQDKMIGRLDQQESLFLSLVLPEQISGLLVHEVTVEGQSGKVLFEVFGKNTEVTAVERGGRLSIEVEIELTVNIGEIDDLTAPFIQPEVISLLEQELGAFLEKEIGQLVKRVQQDFGVDVFGFGAAVKRQLPDRWRQVQAAWAEEFTTLDVQVTARPKIRGSGLLMKPIKMRD